MKAETCLFDAGKNEPLQQRRKEDSKQTPGGAIAAYLKPALGSVVNLPSGANQNDSTSTSNFTAPPTSSTVTLPTAASAHHDTPTLAKTPNPPVPQHSQTGPQMSMHLPKPLQAPPSISHKPAVTSNRPRTIPNILSRSKKKLPSFNCTNPEEGKGNYSTELGENSSYSVMNWSHLEFLPFTCI